MEYQIKKLDGVADEIKSQSFKNFNEAYDCLANIYQVLCCSAADLEYRKINIVLSFQRKVLDFRQIQRILKEPHIVSQPRYRVD